jgi:hypothetical protein
VNDQVDGKVLTGAGSQAQSSVQGRLVARS